jgi:hypothetical protein
MQPQLPEQCQSGSDLNVLNHLALCPGRYFAESDV